MTSMTHSNWDRMSRITQLRSTLGWCLGDLGNGLARLGNRLDEGVPTVDAYVDEYADGYRAGHRAGVSGAMDLMLGATSSKAVAS